MRTGFHGIFQPIADALKLLLKEDITPSVRDRSAFWIAPIIVFVPAFILWVTIPFTEDLVVRNLEYGILYIIAVTVVSIVGIIMASWGSNNKYALIGGARAAAQLISYELPIILVILAVVMLAGTLDMTKIVQGQGSYPYVYLQPLGLVVFLVAGLAELGRTPFDIATAESEIVGGPYVEYSGMHWSIFFLAEYANTFAIGALATVLFLGGWSGPLAPGCDLVRNQDYCDNHGDILAAGDAAPLPHRPTDDHMLAVPDSPDLRQHPGDGHIRILRVALVVDVPDVDGAAGS